MYTQWYALLVRARKCCVALSINQFPEQFVLLWLILKRLGTNSEYWPVNRNADDVNHCQISKYIRELLSGDFAMACCVRDI